MSESSLVTKKAWANKANYEVGRAGYKIKGIVIHHAVTTNISAVDATFANPSRQASAHYTVGGKEIHQHVSEANTAWHCGNWYGNHATVGIETVNSTLAPDYKVSDESLNTLIKLVADIAKRNNLGKLKIDPKADYPTLSGHKDWYGAATACFPIGTEVLTRDGFWAIEDISKEDDIAQWDPETQEITFAKPLDIVEPYVAKVVKVRDTEATENHQMFDISNGKPTKFEWGSKSRFKFPTNANYKAKGLDLTDDEIEYLLWVQADGSYMRDGDCYYGVEFHLKKQRKIERVIGLLDDLGKEFAVTNQTNGTTKIRVYGKQEVLWCEKYLSGKKLTWEWVELSDSQYERFREVIVLADGCAANSSYSSNFQQNIDIVQAILQLHGQPSHVYYGGDQPRLFFANHAYWTDTRYGREEFNALVTCLEMPKGSMIIRQNGRIQIVGNCPGPYLYPKLQYIADRANAINYPPKPVEPTAPTWKDIKATTYETTKEASLYNVVTGAIVSTYKKGTSIGIVQTTTWKGVEYGRTEWRRDKKLNNGFKMSEMAVPARIPVPEREPKPEPKPEPTPTPEPEPTPEDPTVGILQKIVDFIKHVIELITKKQGE